VARKLGTQRRCSIAAPTAIELFELDIIHQITKLIGGNKMEITVLIFIVAIFGIGVGAFALVNATNVEHVFELEVTSKGLKLKSKIDKK